MVPRADPEGLLRGEVTWRAREPLSPPLPVDTPLDGTLLSPPDTARMLPVTDQLRCQTTSLNLCSSFGVQLWLEVDTSTDQMNTWQSCHPNTPTRSQLELNIRTESDEARYRRVCVTNLPTWLSQESSWVFSFGLRTCVQSKNWTLTSWLLKT